MSINKDALNDLAIVTLRRGTALMCVCFCLFLVSGNLYAAKKGKKKNKGEVKASQTDKNQKGLNAVYFAKADLTKPVLRRVDATVNFKWKKGSPGKVVPKNNFSVRWTGKVLADHTETYVFYVEVNDGCRLYIDGKLLIDQWDSPKRKLSAKVDFEAGKLYDIKLEYIEKMLYAAMILSWSSGSIPKEVIPSTHLFSATPQLAGKDKDPTKAAPKAFPQVAPAKERVAIPSVSAQQEALKQLKQLFNLSKTLSSEKKIETANSLLEVLEDTSELPSRFVLLDQARLLAAAGGNTDLAITTAAKM